MVEAGAAMTVLGGTGLAIWGVWKGFKWIGNKYYEWRKGNDKDLQEELIKGKDAQTKVDMNDQFQARPPAMSRR